MICCAENAIITIRVERRKNTVVCGIARIDGAAGRIDTICVIGRGQTPLNIVAEVIGTADAIIAVGVDGGKDTSLSQVT